MITKASFIQTSDTNPYHNLALEEYLLMNCQPGECILYLWQNRHTVVIGRNQNCWKECKIRQLEEDHGFLARRLSGGGAVYHDLGNLNFTFLVRKSDYDIDRQMQVILRAMALLGIHAEKTGRNDATIDGRKFSGNAFYETGDFCYHHGTLLIQTDTGKMSHYLNVSTEKLKSKGVNSVRSRVANLCEFVPDISVSLVSEKMRAAFGEIYGLPVTDLNPCRLDEAAILSSQARFSSWEWKYGRPIPFQYEFSRRFPWGDVQIQLQVSGGMIRQAKVFSDSMDPDWASLLESALTGQRYEIPSLFAAADALPETVRDDVKTLIQDAI